MAINTDACVALNASRCRSALVDLLRQVQELHSLLAVATKVTSTFSLSLSLSLYTQRERERERERERQGGREGGRERE